MTQCNFRVGQKVVCQMMDQASRCHGIRDGSTYEVESIEGDFVRLKGFDGGWYWYRFDDDSGNPDHYQALLTPSKEKVETAMTSTAEILRALRDAIDGFKDCTQYKDEYLRKKHGDEEEIAALEAFYINAVRHHETDQSSTFERCMK